MFDIWCLSHKQTCIYVFWMLKRWKYSKHLCLFSPLCFASFPQWRGKPIKHWVFFQAPTKSPAVQNSFEIQQSISTTFPSVFSLLKALLVCQASVFYWVVRLELNWFKLMWREMVRNNPWSRFLSSSVRSPSQVQQYNKKPLPERRKE